LGAKQVKDTGGMCLETGKKGTATLKQNLEKVSKLRGNQKGGPGFGRGIRRKTQGARSSRQRNGREKFKKGKRKKKKGSGMVKLVGGIQ